MSSRGKDPPAVTIGAGRRTPALAPAAPASPSTATGATDGTAQSQPQSQAAAEEVNARVVSSSSSSPDQPDATAHVPGGNAGPDRDRRRRQHYQRHGSGRVPSARISAGRGGRGRPTAASATTTTTTATTRTYSSGSINTDGQRRQPAAPRNPGERGPSSRSMPSYRRAGRETNTATGRPHAARHNRKQPLHAAPAPPALSMPKDGLPGLSLKLDGARATHQEGSGSAAGPWKKKGAPSHPSSPNADDFTAFKAAATKLSIHKAADADGIGGKRSKQSRLISALSELDCCSPPKAEPYADYQGGGGGGNVPVHPVATKMTAKAEPYADYQGGGGGGNVPVHPVVTETTAGADYGKYDPAPNTPLGRLRSGDRLWLERSLKVPPLQHSPVQVGAASDLAGGELELLGGVGKGGPIVAASADQAAASSPPFRPQPPPSLAASSVSSASSASAARGAREGRRGAPAPVPVVGPGRNGNARTTRERRGRRDESGAFPSSTAKGNARDLPAAGASSRRRDPLLRRAIRSVIHALTFGLAGGGGGGSSHSKASLPPPPSSSSERPPDGVSRRARHGQRQRDAAAPASARASSSVSILDDASQKGKRRSRREEYDDHSEASRKVWQGDAMFSRWVDLGLELAKRQVKAGNEYYSRGDLRRARKCFVVVTRIKSPLEGDETSTGGELDRYIEKAKRMLLRIDAHLEQDSVTLENWIDVGLELAQKQWRAGNIFYDIGDLDGAKRCFLTIAKIRSPLDCEDIPSQGELSMLVGAARQMLLRIDKVKALRETRERQRDIATQIFPQSFHLADDNVLFSNQEKPEEPVTSPTALQVHAKSGDSGPAAEDTIAQAAKEMLNKAVSMPGRTAVPMHPKENSEENESETRSLDQEVKRAQMAMGIARILSNSGPKEDEENAVDEKTLDVFLAVHKAFFSEHDSDAQKQIAKDLASNSNEEKREEEVFSGEVTEFTKDVPESVPRRDSASASVEDEQAAGTHGKLSLGVSRGPSDQHHEKEVDKDEFSGRAMSSASLNRSTPYDGRQTKELAATLDGGALPHPGVSASAPSASSNGSEGREGVNNDEVHSKGVVDGTGTHGEEVQEELHFEEVNEKEHYVEGVGGEEHSVDEEEEHLISEAYGC